mmetsp:Transcript_28308/g.27139  ORF Transcript_28308/g.27139 Transcript_28308/m.27139 type:complete len:190 (-) Transcript_28308:390-959(-)
MIFRILVVIAAMHVASGFLVKISPMRTRCSYSLNAGPEIPEWDNVFEALLVYEDLNKNMNPPEKFVIPSDDAAWPEACWGMKLGLVVDQIRLKGAFKDHTDDLTDMGFDFEKQDDWLFVKNAIMSYQNIHGHFQIPTTFRFPAKDAALVEELWGYPLGKTVSGIRTGKKYEKYHDELQAMGFDMKNKRK